jgi:hypothetical protein
MMENTVNANTRFKLTVQDGALVILDERDFEGTVEEAVEELKAEYDEFFPSHGPGIAGIVEPDEHYRGPDFWAKRLDQLTRTRYTGVQGKDKIKGMFRTFEMARV